jgi:DNA-binding NarL/FixJ family response regulator
MLAYRGIATMPPPPESQLVEQSASHDLLTETVQVELRDEIQAAPVVAIIDHRTLSRDGLANAIEEAGAGYHAETFANLDDWRIDDGAPQRTTIIIISMDSFSGDHAREVDDLACLKTQYPSINVLALGDDDDPDLVVSVLAAGSQGYLSRSLSLEVVLGAIGLVQSGGVFVPADSLIQLYQRQAGSTRSMDLTDGVLTAQQVRVAQELLVGKANKIIAHELHIRESTVKVHVRNIMRKLQAHNRTEVALKLNTWPQLRRRRKLF